MADDKKWDNDKVQFARLLSEIKAAIEPDAMAELVLSLAVSMDLSTERVEELFERAEVAWEAAIMAQAGHRLELE